MAQHNTSDMKKLLLLAVVIAAMLTSCKQEVKTVEAPVQTEATPSVETDTVAAKAAVEKEKEELAKPYNEQEDAQAKLNELIAKAKQEGKNVFVQAGGNWCIWCLRFNDFVQKNEDIKKVVDANYEYYHLNYSKENKNKEVFAKYAPEGLDLGFPFFFVINGNGEVTKVFSSVDLEAEKSYDVAKVKQMFIDNAPKK
jgi:thioredoxin-related protein